MTPEVKELVEAATAMGRKALKLPEIDKETEIVIRRLAKAVAAVKQMDDPKSAHEAAIARRVAEDRDYGQQDIVMGR